MAGKFDEGAVRHVAAAIDAALGYVELATAAAGDDRSASEEQARHKIQEAGRAAIAAFQAYEPPHDGPRPVR